MIYKRLLLVSLAINLILGFILFNGRATRPPVPREVASPQQTSATRTDHLEPTRSESKAFGWESVEAPDYKQYIKNLRAVGCPEETIRDIIEADVMKLYEEKKKQVRREGPKFEYWKGDGFVRGAGRESWVKMHALDEERDNVLRELGVEPNYRKRAVKNQNAMEWMLDFLDEGKRAEILRRFREFENMLNTRPPNSIDGNQMMRLHKELEASIKQQLLTPEEALQFDLRMSPVANRLKHQLRGMDNTEDEFIKLYKLHAAHEAALQAADPNVSAAERRAAEKLANDKLDDQIKQALGSERYVDYQMVHDTRYQNAYTFALQVGLGAQETKDLYRVIKEAEQAALQIRTSPDVPPEKRGEALQAIRRETEQAMRNMVGERAWEQHKQRPLPRALLSKLDMSEED